MNTRVLGDGDPTQADSQNPNWLSEDLAVSTGSPEVTEYDLSGAPDWLVGTPMDVIEDESQVDEVHEQQEWIDRIRFYYHSYNQQYRKLRKLLEGAQDAEEKESFLERIYKLREAAQKYFDAMSIIEKLGTNPELLQDAIRVYNEGVENSRVAELPLTYPQVVIELFKDSTIKVDYNQLIDNLTEVYAMQATSVERIRKGEVELSTLRDQVVQVFARLNMVIPDNYVPSDPELRNRDVFIAKLTMVVLKDQSLLATITELRRFQLSKLLERLQDKVSAL